MSVEEAQAWTARPDARCAMVIIGDGARMTPSCAPWPSNRLVEKAAALCHVPVHGYSHLVQVRCDDHV